MFYLCLLRIQKDCKFEAVIPQMNNYCYRNKIRDREWETQGRHVLSRQNNFSTASSDKSKQKACVSVFDCQTENNMPRQGPLKQDGGSAKPQEGLLINV